MNNIRDVIEMRFANFGRAVCRRPWLFLLLSILAFLSMAYSIPQIRMDTSAEGLLHREAPSLTVYEEFRRQFGRDQMVIIGLNPEDIFDRTFLDTLRELHSALEEEVPYVDEVTSLINVEHMRGEDDDLIVEDLLEELPRDEKGMKDLKNTVLANPLYRNIIISDDGSFTVVILKPVLFIPGSGEEPAPLGEEEFGQLADAVSRVCDRFRSPDFPLYLGGDIMAENVLKTMTMNTMYRFTAISAMVIVVVFAFLFRRLSAVIIPLIIVLCSLYSTIGLMAAFGVPITLNTTILPSFILAVGIGDSVHIMAIYYRHLRKKGDRTEAVSFALGHSGLAVVMTTMTTAGGLLSFATAGIAPVANLGIFAAVGVSLALLFTLVALPAMLAVTPMRKKDVIRTSGSGLDNFLGGVGDFATAHPWKIVIISVFLFLGSLLLALQLHFSHNSLTYLKEDVPVRKATEIIDSKLKGSVNVEVLVDTGTPQGLYDPVVMNRIEEAQQMAEGLVIGGKPVGRATAVTDMVKEINKALNSGAASEYRIPEDRELIAQELLLYEIGGGENLDEVVDRDYSKARITVRVPWVDAVIYNKALAELEQNMQDIFSDKASVTITGLAKIIISTLAEIIHTMGESYLIAGCVITVLMVLLIGNIRLGLSSMAPNVLPIVLGLGLMKIAGIPLDYSTIMVGGIAIGLAVDDTVHFMHNFRRYYAHTGDAREAVRMTLTTTGRAMLFTTIILASGFYILIFAELRSTMNFGIITGFTITTALMADFLLAPAMMVLLTRNR